MMVDFDTKNKDRRLKGGEYIQVEVALRRSMPTLWVPSSSIVDASAGMFVMKVQYDTIRTVMVKQGVRKDGVTEVYGNLKENDIIAVKGSEELRDGTKVIIEEKGI